MISVSVRGVGFGQQRNTRQLAQRSVNLFDPIPYAVAREIGKPSIVFVAPDTAAGSRQEIPVFGDGCFSEIADS